jgi:hypothetical protein
MTIGNEKWDAQVPSEEELIPFIVSDSPDGEKARFSLPVGAWI